MEGIQVSTEVAGSEGQISIIKVGGYIDTTTSSEVERALNSLLKQGRYKIIIDLGNVDYISSAGWGIFISEIKSIRENNGDLKLVSMIPDVYEIFELLEFHHILDVYDSNQEAIQKFQEAEYAGVPSMASSFSQTPEESYDAHANTPPGAEETETASEFEETSEKDETPHVTQAKEPQTQRDLSSISVENKIKHIVAHNPNFGAYKINKKLNTLEFGFTKVGWFGVRSMLNKLGLNSRTRRREFTEKYFQAES
jgi:anti-sigma B factor antagonist